MSIHLVPLTPEGAAAIAGLFQSSVSHYAATQDEFSTLLNAVAQNLDLPKSVRFNQPKVNRLCHLGEEGGNKTLSRCYLQCWEQFLPYDLDELEDIAAGQIQVPAIRELVFPSLPPELRFLRKKKQPLRYPFPPVILVYPARNCCLKRG